MLSIGCPDNGARWLVGSSLKFIVGGVFVNGKMAVSLPDLPVDSLISAVGVKFNCSLFFDATDSSIAMLSCRLRVGATLKPLPFYRLFTLSTIYMQLVQVSNSLGHMTRNSSNKLKMLL